MLNAEAVAAGAKTDLDELGIVKNSREEKLQARKKPLTPEEKRHNEEMGKLYREHVLKEQPTIQIAGLGGAKKPEPVQPVNKSKVV